MGLERRNEHGWPEGRTINILGESWVVDAEVQCQA